MAPAAGPILGGALVDHGLWRWIFYINIPIGLLGVLLGFTVLVVNTWQLSLLDATTSIGYIRFLMVLRGFALGATVQSTFTTALGTVDRKQVARGSSLVNSTRFVVQSVGVALLTTILASSLSPATRALQQKAQIEQRGASAPTRTSAAPVAGGLCGHDDATALSCKEHLIGFERAYRFTFYAACLALVLGALLPGWPFGWAGRGEQSASTDEGDGRASAAA